jgi:hypothetical protein
MQLWHFLTARCYSRWGISLPTAVSLKRKNLFRHLESMAGQLQSSFDRLERELVDDPHRAARVQALVETIADAIIGGLPVHEKVQPWLYAQNIFDRGLWVLDRAFPGYRQSGLLFLLVVNPNGANHVR